MRGPLQAGESVLLIDRKQRRYLITLAAGEEFHSHAGLLAHDDLIGASEGVQVRTTRNMELTVLRPTLAEIVLKMPRHAQVVYPKDIAPILMLADIHPGARVLESGVGSGALSMGLLRAGAEVTGYEIREDFADKARSNVERFLGVQAAARYRVEIRDSTEGLEVSDIDRVVLDLPEPWRVVPHAVQALRSGGIIVAYTPSIVQAAQVRESLEDGRWAGMETLEVLQRGWHIKEQAVRPNHRMVGHTGFLTFARRLADSGG